MCAVIDGRLLLLAIFLQISRRSLADISDNALSWHLNAAIGARSLSEFIARMIHCKTETFKSQSKRFTKLGLRYSSDISQRLKAGKYSG